MWLFDYYLNCLYRLSTDFRYRSVGLFPTNTFTIKLFGVRYFENELRSGDFASL
jgi:hypothetical protein